MSWWKSIFGGEDVKEAAGAKADAVMLHILPTGIKRIRHYGLLASSCKAVKLNAARAALQMPLPSAQAMESAQGFIARVAKMDVGLCPCCRLARLHVGAVLAGQARLPEPIGVVTQHSRGPPS